MLVVADWPDYSTDDDGGSDVSEVEQIVAGAPASDSSSSLLDASALPALGDGDAHTALAAAAAAARSLSSSHSTVASTAAAAVAGGGGAVAATTDFTAQRIMHLFTELGSSNVLETSSSLYMEHSFVHCSHCTGRLLNL